MIKIILPLLFLNPFAQAQIDKKQELKFKNDFYKMNILLKSKNDFKRNKKSLLILYKEYVSGSKPILKKANDCIEIRANGSKRYTTNYYFYRQQKLDEFEKEFCYKNNLKWFSLRDFREKYGNSTLKDYEYFKKE